MMIPAAYQHLVQALDQLPAVGPRAAGRLAQHLLNGADGQQLLQALQQALSVVQHCQQCRHFSLTPLCPVCCDEQRDASEWLVVTTVDEVQQAEQAGWRGRYFVLHGLLSPMAGRGPRQLGLDRLQQRAQAHAGPLQVVVALDDSAEARATQTFIAGLLHEHAMVSAIIWDDWLQQRGVSA